MLRGFSGLLSGEGLKRARYCLASLRVELALSRSKKKSCRCQRRQSQRVEAAWPTLWASLSLFSPLAVLLWLVRLDRLAATEPKSRCKHLRVSGRTLLRSVGRHPAIVHGLSTVRERESRSTRWNDDSSIAVRGTAGIKRLMSILELSLSYRLLHTADCGSCSPTRSRTYLRYTPRQWLERKHAPLSLCYLSS